MTVFGKCANEACKRVYDLTGAQSTYNNIVVSSFKSFFYIVLDYLVLTYLFAGYL